MFQLEEKIWFWAFLVIPLVILSFALLQFWKRSAQNKFADRDTLKKLSPNTSIFKPILKVSILCLALASLILGLINLKVGTKIESIKREGVDIVFAVDVSKSMLAEDIAPNRLEKAKQLVSQVINNLGSDRVGIIAYAGTAAPQLPITTDYAAAKMFLQSMNTDMLSSQGTAISEAIELAKTYYNDDEQTNRVLIILSDGEDHVINAPEVAQEAKELGIRIFTIGLGTTKGGQIPEKRNGVLMQYKKDKNGATVITRLDEDNLKNIASNADGFYINGANTTQVVETIKETLDTMDKTEFESKQIADFESRFQWFLGFALLLLVLDLFLFDRKTAWVKRMNLFNEQKP